MTVTAFAADREELTGQCWLGPCKHAGPMPIAAPDSRSTGLSVGRPGPTCNTTTALACGILCALGAGACVNGEDVGSASATAIAVPGPWQLPDDVRAAGDEQFVEFTGAGPWRGEEGCGGGLLDGTGLLRDYLYQHFPQSWEIGGYSCRPIVGDPNSMSVHATGRALDIMVYPVGHPDGSEADNEMGDPIANWLVVNAEHIGVQQIIWDRWLWRAEDAPGEKDRAYTGEHPHNDHLHVELSVEAADLGTPFFQTEQGPPELPSCGRLPAEGGIIDDLDRCAEFFGPPQYWRAVDGSGHGGALLWTDSFEADAPSNWARWSLDLAAAGRYRVEYHAVADYAVAPRVRYEIHHGDATEVVWIDQGSAEGWVSLGEFEFAAGGYQYVAVFDNVDGPVAEGQHIVFDALRLVPCAGEGQCDAGPGPEPETPEPETPEPGEDPGSDDPGDGQAGGGGCAAAMVASSGANGWMVAWLLLACIVIRTGRRRANRR